MHNIGTTIRYCKIPRFREYEINSFGEVRKVGENTHIESYLDNDTGEPRIILVNNFGDIVNIMVARLMLITFIGEIELPIIYKDNEDKWNVAMSNIKYKIPEYFKEQCSKPNITEVKLAGMRFRRIPKLPKYFISETGIVYSIRNKKFNSISFDKDGYRFSSFFNYTNKKKPYRIHRLVFETFEHEIKKGYVIDHFLSDKNMNNIGNLSEMTVLENNIKAYQMDGKVISHTKDEIRKLVSLKSENKSNKEIGEILGYNDNGDTVRALWYAITHNIAHFDILNETKNN